jgi:hypothetical protein
MKASSYVVLFTAVVAVSLLCAGLGTGSVFAASQPTQYDGGGYVCVSVLGFTYLNYLEPVPWANVTASNGHMTFQGATGTSNTCAYELFLPPGTYNVTASEPGYLQTSQSVVVSNGSSTAISMYLYQSQVPVPEFQPQLTPAVLMLALACVLLAKRSAKRRPLRSATKD